MPTIRSGSYKIFYVVFFSMERLAGVSASVPISCQGSLTDDNWVRHLRSHFQTLSLLELRASPQVELKLPHLPCALRLIMLPVQGLYSQVNSLDLQATCHLC